MSITQKIYRNVYETLLSYREYHDRNSHNGIPSYPQSIAIKGCIDNPRAMINLATGLGKTLIPIYVLQELNDITRKRNKALVLAPYTVSDNVWTQEEIDFYRCDGLKIKHISNYREKLDGADIYVLSHGKASSKNYSELAQMHWDMIVIDESQNFLYRTTNRVKFLLEILTVEAIFVVKISFYKKNVK